MKVESDICIRCGLPKKTVREEGNMGCYVYGKKVANRHMRSYIDDSLPKDISLDKKENIEK